MARISIESRAGYADTSFARKMTVMTADFGICLFAIGGIFSVYFGMFACDVFGVPWPKNWHRRFYLVLFNFSGSAFGWGALFLTLRKFEAVSVVNSPIGIDWTDLVMGILAFVGITGHLPMVFMGSFEALRVAMNSVLEKMKVQS